MTVENFLISSDFKSLRELVRFSPEGLLKLQEAIELISPPFYRILCENPEICQEILEGIIEFSEKQIEEMAKLEAKLKPHQRKFSQASDGSWEDVDFDGSQEQTGSDGKFKISSSRQRRLGIGL